METLNDMEYISYFKDENLRRIDYQSNEEKSSTINKLIDKFGEGHYKVIYWDDRFDIENGFDMTDSEDLSMQEAIERADNLVGSYGKASANVWAEDDTCVYCVNWYSEDDIENNWFD